MKTKINSKHNGTFFVHLLALVNYIIVSKYFNCNVFQKSVCVAETVWICIHSWSEVGNGSQTHHDDARPADNESHSEPRAKSRVTRMRAVISHAQRGLITPTTKHQSIIQCSTRMIPTITAISRQKQQIPADMYEFSRWNKYSRLLMVSASQSVSDDVRSLRQWSITAAKMG